MTLEQRINHELKQVPDISIINLVDYVIAYAEECLASDIHIDPTETNLRVRLRIDGILKDIFSFPKQICSEIISRIKVLAGLRTDLHLSAQDGRFRICLEEGSPIDIRVSIAPAYYGENAVLRLLSDNAGNFDLHSLGLKTSDLEKVTDALKKPHGMILATGPTGSGKTTTLYTLIKLLNAKESSIITIEDPVEYAIPDIRQIQVNALSGLTFATGLRSILRQDPNIIMVGEIRDMETASIAVNTALTGHLLLSTLHTNNAATTLPRLLDMKIDPYLIASTVNLAIGQRLVRRICSACKKQRMPSEAEKKNLAEIFSSRTLDDQKYFYGGSGCEYCGGSGYKGRIGIYEILMVLPNIREAILEKSSAAKIKELAVKNGMTTMIEDGLEKVKSGETTVEEILRAVHSS